MDANEFWCRAFLAAMSGCYSSEDAGSRHEAAAEYCGKAAKAALAEAERCGIFARKEKTDVAPKLDRVEFRADREGNGSWVLSTEMYPAGLWVVEGDEVIALVDGNTIRVKWNESMPPKPIEVWIERRPEEP